MVLPLDAIQKLRLLSLTTAPPSTIHLFLAFMRASQCNASYHCSPGNMCYSSRFPYRCFHPIKNCHSVFFHNEFFESKISVESTDDDTIIPSNLCNEILPIATSSWNGKAIPSSLNSANEDVTIQESESYLPCGIDWSARTQYFFRQAEIKGCPKAQHSIALMYWNEYGGIQQDPALSAKWHAAAAIQGHLDGIALLGGILRTERTQSNIFPWACA